MTRKIDIPALSFLLFVMLGIIGMAAYLLYDVTVQAERAGAWCKEQGYTITSVSRSGTLCMTKEGYLVKPFTVINKAQ